MYSKFPFLCFLKSEIAAHKKCIIQNSQRKKIKSADSRLKNLATASKCGKEQELCWNLFLTLKSDWSKERKSLEFEPFSNLDILKSFRTRLTPFFRLTRSLLFDFTAIAGLNRAATKRLRTQTHCIFTHPIFESDFDCLTGKNRIRALFPFLSCLKQTIRIISNYPYPFYVEVSPFYKTDLNFVSGEQSTGCV